MFRKIHSLKVTLFTFLLTTFAFQANYAQVPGSVDVNFNSPDIALYNGLLNPSNNYKVYSVAIQNDHKIIMGTNFSDYNGEQISPLTRLNSDGSIDGSFNVSILGGFVNTIVFQTDGKILIGGSFTTCNGIPRRMIARLNADGSLDATFDPGTGFTPNTSGGTGVNVIALQSDGKILVGGGFSSYNSISRNGIARLNTNGTLDGTFAPGSTGFQNEGVVDIQYQPDGKILLCGDRYSLNSIIRVNIDGTIDSSFLHSAENVRSMLLLSDGKIMIGREPWVNDDDTKCLYRLNTDGTLDNSFNTLYDTAGIAGVFKILKQSDNKIVYLRGSGLFRLNIDGSQDVSYNNNVGKTLIGNSIAIQPDNEIINFGGTNGYNNVVRSSLKRYDIDGKLDKVLNPITGLVNYAQTSKSIVQPDGKVLICGPFILYNRMKVSGIFRINSDGSFDETFVPNLLSDTNPVFVYDMELQPDGKILIRGDFKYCDGIPRNSIARLNSNGSLDTSFNPGTGINLNSGSPKGLIALQQDGKIIIPAFGNSYNGVVKNGVIRLNTDGTIDNFYNDQTINWFYDGFSHVGSATIYMQPDQKIIIFGMIMGVNGVTKYGMARLNTDGTLDTTFDVGTGFFDSSFNRVTVNLPNIIRFQSNNKIIFAGNMSYTTPSSGNFALARLNANGSRDATFAGIPPNMINIISDIAIQNDDKLIIGSSGYKPLRRLNANGSDDTTFYTGSATNYTDYNGNNLTGSMSTISLKSDGKIIVTGGFETFNGIFRKNIVQLNGGNLITSPPIFNTSNSNANGEIQTMAKYSDNKVILGGKFETYNSQSARKITKINSNGSKDSAFNSGTGFGTGFVNVKSTAIQQDGKLIVVGDFVVYNGVTIKNITRLNQDGTIDSSFNTGSGASALINSVAIQQDGKIIIAGNFSSYNGTSRNKIARLNIDGTLDTTFITGTGFDATVSCIAIQNDGKILVGGMFDSYNGQSAYKLARLNPDGSFDSSFVVSFSISSTTSLAIQQDGKIITGGYYNGTTPVTNYLKRLNTNGSIDTTFNQTVNGQTKSIAFQPDGKILIGGDFTIVENTGRNRFARLYQNGKLDRTLDIGLGANAAVNSIVMKNDGAILIAGAFTSFNGYTANYITEIQSGLLNTVSNYFEDITLYPNPVNDILNIDLPDYSEIREINVFDLTGKRVLFENKIFNTIDFSNLSTGLYLLQLKTSEKSLVRKIVKQ